MRKILGFFVWKIMILRQQILFIFSNFRRGACQVRPPPWIRPWSPLTLWVQIPLRRGVLYTTLCDKVCQWLAAGLWFSLGIPVSSTNKTDHHDIAEILLKVVLNTINLTPSSLNLLLICYLYDKHYLKYITSKHLLENIFNFYAFIWYQNCRLLIYVNYAVSV
jgi:hypothetical protein